MNAPTIATADDPRTRALTLPRSEVLAALRRAGAKIAPLWSLDSFVAVNPYLGLIDQRFDQVAHLLAETAGARSTLPASFYLDAVDDGRITLADLVGALAVRPEAGVADVAELIEAVGSAPDDPSAHAVGILTVADFAASVTGTDVPRLVTDRVSAWAASYFDTGQAMWRSAVADDSPYDAWRFEATVDRTPEVMGGLRGFRSFAADLPEDAATAAGYALAELGIGCDGVDLYLHRLLLRFGGWAGHAARIVWDRDLAGEDDDTLVEFAAVLLCWELGVLTCVDDPELGVRWAEACSSIDPVGTDPAPRPALARLLVLQDAFDRSEQRRLCARLGNGPAGIVRASRSQAQAVFCIDVRSEVFRRNLERVSPAIDTLGFAGFFGFAVDHIGFGHETGGAQCPVLLTPAHTVHESTGDADRDTALVRQRRRDHQVARAWKSFKSGAVSCFGFVSPVGLAYLPKLLTDSFAMTRPVADPPPAAAPSVEPRGDGSGIAIDDQRALAERALRAMSLTSGFAPLVLIVGHGASTTNNPYGSGLDCGACGGRSGDVNARVAATVLNSPQVRAGLVERGIEIPADTHFVACLHDTTTDTISVFERERVPDSHLGLLDVVEADLADAGRRSRAERAPRLGIAPHTDVDAAIFRRSRDWAQVRPEWGLAGCRAFVVAPRHRTRDVDLEGRSFLHSYDWRADEGFEVLETIMTAPMVVASWISLQYYASTVDQTVFGAGDKTLHNVVGRLGVFEGNAGDLRVGLPHQSVHDGASPRHEPIRLKVVIEAPIDAMTDVIDRHPMVRQLCDNGWINLLAMGVDGAVSHRYAGDLAWAPLEDS